MEQRRDRRRNEEESTGGWWWAGAVTVAAAAAGVYYATRGSRTTPLEDSTAEQRERERLRSPPGLNYSTYLNDLLRRSSYNEGIRFEGPRINSDAIPDNPNITNLNSLLCDMYVRYIAIRKNDFELHYKVFNSIFYSLHQKMKDVDKYYNRYSSMVQFAGSHYDRLRIKKPDEFDMDVVIGLPLSYRCDPFNVDDSDFIIEPKDAGYVYLKMGTQYKKLPERDSQDWEINKTAYKWSDENNYLLRSKFTDWFKGVVDKALNTFDFNIYLKPIYEVDGVVYTIDKSQSGPAITIKIKNTTTNFQMDVDLVPALKFPEDRWPPGPDYRNIPYKCKKDYWMVVPKPNKNGQCDVSRSRSWRIAMHYQERELIYNTNNLRQSIRLLKKFRDSQGMDKIASYYLKTLVFWEIERINDPSYWNSNPAELFKLMVKIFHKAMVEGNIPYFWNKHNNLIEGIHRQVFDSYSIRIRNLMNVLEVPSEYKKVAKFLLTPAEFEDYNRRFLHI